MHRESRRSVEGRQQPRRKLHRKGQELAVVPQEARQWTSPALDGIRFRGAAHDCSARFCITVIRSSSSSRAVEPCVKYAQPCVSGELVRREETAQHPDIGFENGDKHVSIDAYLQCVG